MIEAWFAPTPKSCPHINHFSHSAQELVLPHILVHTALKFQGYEFGWFAAGVGDGVGVVAGEPFVVSGFEVAGHGALRAFGIVAFDVATNVEIGDGY